MSSIGKGGILAMAAFVSCAIFSNVYALDDYWEDLEDPPPPLATGPVTYAKTKWPIVLVHGKGGETAPGKGEPKFAGNEYWYGIPFALRQSGASVHVASLTGAANEYVRCLELRDQIKNIFFIEQTKAYLAGTPIPREQKVNLIAHSQGGLTARCVAATWPDAVASVTTIGTPHRGTVLADIAVTMPNAAAWLINLVGGANASWLGITSGSSNEGELAALRQLSTGGMAEFNSRYSSPGLPPESWNCPIAGSEIDTRYGHRLYSFVDQRLPVVVEPFDWTSWGLAAAHALILSTSLQPSDGLVPFCSARFGKEIFGTGDHADQINQIVASAGLADYHPVTRIVTHANRLKLDGL